MTAFVSLLLLFLVLAPLVAEESPGPVSVADSGQATKPQAEPRKIDIPIPIGDDVKGLRIPHFNENGELAMELDAKVARKIDQDNVEMEDLTIDVYDEDKRKVVIFLPKSNFNLQTKILTGDSSVMIQRDDFQLSGDSVTFSAETRNSEIVGNVRMVIQDITNFENE